MREIFALLLGFAPAALGAPDLCRNELRAVLDLGSGSVKLTLAETEHCKTKIRFIRVIADNQSVALPLEASKDASGNIPASVQAQAIQILRQLKSIAFTQAKEMDPPRSKIAFTVVGTHAFRTARNMREFAGAIESAGFSIRALTQIEEGKAALDAVKQSGRGAICGNKELSVWDIGGGSMQLVKAGHIYGFEMGAESFKSRLMDFMKKDKTTCQLVAATPNPIGAGGVAKARNVAVKTARKLLCDTPPPKMADLCVVGVGGVHNKAIEQQIGRHWNVLKSCVCSSWMGCSHKSSSYSKRELECLAKILSTKSDCDPEIKGPYSSTSVSNLFFVLGWMDLMGIEMVHTADVNIGQALVTTPLEFRGESEPVK